MYEERKNLGFLSFLFTLCHKLSKSWGFFNTHLSSYPDNQFEHLKRRSEQHRQLCSALHAYKFAVATSELQRTQSRHYTYMGVSRYMRLLSRFRLQTTYSPENSRSWAAVSFGTLTFGIGLIPSSGCSRQNCLIIDITCSSEIKNFCSERTLMASSKRSRCTSVQ